MQLALAVAAVPLEPAAHLPLAPMVVLVEKETIQVVAPQQVLAQAQVQAQAQVLAQAAAVLRQRILRQRILRPNHVYQVSVWETRDITQRTVIITALMEHLDANVQIHTNAQLDQLS